MLVTYETYKGKSRVNQVPDLLIQDLYLLMTLHDYNVSHQSLQIKEQVSSHNIILKCPIMTTKLLSTGFTIKIGYNAMTMATKTNLILSLTIVIILKQGMNRKSETSIWFQETSFLMMFWNVTISAVAHQ